VQQQPQPVVIEVAEAVADPLDLLIWNGAVKWGAAGEQLLVFGWCVGEVAGGRWPGEGWPGPRRSGVDRRTATLMFADRDRKSAVRRPWPQT
jgi:hypothetical protein